MAGMLLESPTIGKLISHLRSEKGWTQKEFAERIGMHPNHVSRMEKDKMQPRRSTLKKVAEVLEVAVEDLESASQLAQDGPTSRLSEEDPELAALVSQVVFLNEEQREALRVFLRSMLTCQKLQGLAAGKLG